jgi:hypothetical protein
MEQEHMGRMRGLLLDTGSHGFPPMTANQRLTTGRDTTVLKRRMQQSPKPGSGSMPAARLTDTRETAGKRERPEWSLLNKIRSPVALYAPFQWQFGPLDQWRFRYQSALFASGTFATTLNISGGES